MATKTFAYQLGERCAIEEFDRDALGGTVTEASAERRAAEAVAVRYLPDDFQSDEFTAGFLDAWQRNLELPEFLWAAPKEPATIITHPALWSALVAAFPDVKQLGFHDQLAVFLIEHMTRKPGRG
ncbi:MAG TPA: hypothetical protein VGL36_35630 [Kribbella sp.]